MSPDELRAEARSCLKDGHGTADAAARKRLFERALELAIQAEAIERNAATASQAEAPPKEACARPSRNSPPP
jgi:hypothetical protein